jgi:hypothetical protein
VSARLPNIIEVESGRRWLAESRKFAPGTYWTVTYAMEPYALDEVTGRYRKRWEMRCTCPHGEAQVDYPLELRTPCAHMRAAVAHTDAKHRRPAAPVNASAFVD